MTNGFGNMNKLIPKYVEDEDEIFPIKFMTKEEAEEILAIMWNQDEMFLGGLNDPLMNTMLGSYTELREKFDEVNKVWNELAGMLQEVVKNKS